MAIRIFWVTNNEFFVKYSCLLTEPGPSDLLLGTSADSIWTVLFDTPRSVCSMASPNTRFASVHGPRLAGCCLHSNSQWNGVSRQILTARRDGNPFPGADHHRDSGEGSFSQISMPLMVVTLPVVFDGFKDHGKNKQSQQ